MPDPRIACSGSRANGGKGSQGPVRALVVDDEPLARERTARILTEAGCTVAGLLENGWQFQDWLLGAQEADVVFLDIKMPGPSGMDVVASAHRTPPIVFVTAHQEFAVRAFDLAAKDYLLKPLNPDRVLACIRRLDPSHSQQGDRVSSGSGLGRVRQVPIRIAEGELFLDLEKITHFDVDEERVYACHGDERFRTKWTSLAEVESSFPGEGLVRIQRHILLRPAAVRGIRPSGIGRIKVLVPQGKELEVSRTMTREVRARVQS